MEFVVGWLSALGAALARNFPGRKCPVVALVLLYWNLNFFRSGPKDRNAVLPSLGDLA